MWRDAGTPDPVFTDTLELDLGTVEPSPGRAEAAAGPGGADQDAATAFAKRPDHRTMGVPGDAGQQARSRSRARTTTSAMATW